MERFIFHPMTTVEKRMTDLVTHLLQVILVSEEYNDHNDKG